MTTDIQDEDVASHETERSYLDADAFLKNEESTSTVEESSFIEVASQTKEENSAVPIQMNISLDEINTNKPWRYVIRRDILNDGKDNKGSD